MSTIKSVPRTARRIIEKVESGNYTPDMIEHMIESLIKNRDNTIDTLQKAMRPREFILSESDISGALRDTINAHGSITSQFIGSAAKRIFKSCQKIIEEK